MRALWAGGWCVAAVAVSAGPAAADPAWQPREEVADLATGSMSRGFIGADGVGKLIGDPSQRFPSKFKLGLRPPGGPTGAFAALPGNLGSPSLIGVHDPAGNLLLGDGTQIAYRPAGLGSAVGPIQQLPGGSEISAMAVAPSGEALVGIGSNPARVAFRPAGPAAQVDVANAQTLPGSVASDRIVGMALDADGAAVVVYTSGGSLVQITRAAGSASFSGPVAIPSPLADPTKYKVWMDSNPAGWGILTWSGKSPTGGGSPDTAIASIRSPGGAFGSPVVLGTGGVNLSVTGAVDANGHAVAAWDDKAAIYSAGSWGSATVLGGGVNPAYGSTGRNMLEGEGNTIVVPAAERFPGPSPSTTDDTSRLVLHRATLTPEGFRFVDPVEIEASANSSGGIVHPDFVDVSLEPSGRTLTLHTLYPKVYARAFEDPSAPPPAGGGGTQTPADATPGGGGSAPPSDVPGAPSPGGSDPAPFILPIKPVKLVAVGALDPKKPSVSVTCPPEAGRDCLVTVTLRALFQANARAAARKTTTIGSVSGKVKPGRKGRLVIKLNRAGRKLVAKRKAAKVQVVTTIRVGDQKGTVTKNTTLKAARRR